MRRDHNEYGKRVMRVALGSAYSECAPPLIYPGGGRAIIDGVIDGKIAVEIEARNDKQIRGAIMDLVCHELPKKLLVLITANTNSPDSRKIVQQSEYLLERFAGADASRVVVLAGQGGAEKMAEDIDAVRCAAIAFGVRVTAEQWAAVRMTDYLPRHLLRPPLLP